MTRLAWFVASVLAAAIALLLGVALGRLSVEPELMLREAQIAGHRGAWVRLRRGVEAVWTNYIGQEGRGAATGVRREVLRLMDQIEPTRGAGV